MHTAAKAIEPGQWLGGTYRIVRQIGAGGMGVVYEATHARLSGRYAVKILHEEMCRDPGLVARFKREAEITSVLRHPNIVNVVDFSETEAGQPYLVMEFLGGVDLVDVLRAHGRLAPGRAARLIDQIASGVAAAHEMEIVHRDLKPGNIFITPLPGRDQQEAVKIVDFGISKIKSGGVSLTQTSSIVGTPLYMAPEQIRGRADDIGPNTDQFSMATIAYEMLTGRPPFAGDDLATITYKLVHEPPPSLASHGVQLGPEVEAVLFRALAKQPQDRFATVSEFAHAFTAALEWQGSGLKSLPPMDRASSVQVSALAETITTGARSRPPTRRRQWPLVVAALAALSAVAAGYLFVARSQPSAVPVPPPRPATVHPVVVPTPPVVEPTPPAAVEVEAPMLAPEVMAAPPPAKPRSKKNARSRRVRVKEAPAATKSEPAPVPAKRFNAITDF